VNYKTVYIMRCHVSNLDWDPSSLQR